MIWEKFRNFTELYNGLWEFYVLVDDLSLPFEQFIVYELTQLTKILYMLCFT